MEDMKEARWACFALLLWLTVIGQAGADTLWSIGTPDKDYKEFAIAGRYGEYVNRFPKDVTFRIGPSRPESDWPYIQPGPTDAWAGMRAHPFRIEFDLAAVPSGACRLNVDLVNTHYGQAPLLEINVNDRMSYRFQLPAGGTDESLTNPKAGRPVSLSLPFPARHLVAGRNRITLTVAAGSWLLYDALRLESGVEMPQEPEIAGLEAQSTMLFKWVNGELRQAVRVTVNNVGIEGKIEARLTGAREQAQTVSLLPGANTFYVLVTPFDKVSREHLTVRAGGKERAVEFEGKPERKWRVYAAPSAHTDIGYTDWQERVFERHSANTADALKAAAQNPAFKWNLEVGYQAPMFREHYPKDFPALVERLREGRFGLQGLYLNMLTGLCSGEELVRALTRAPKLGQVYGFKVESANLSDVPTSVGTMPMLLSQAGIRYFAEGVNQDRGPLFSYFPRNLHQSPVWWEGMDGSRVLAWFAYGYAQMGGLGLTHSVEEAAARIPGWLKGFDRKDYPCDAVFVYGAFSDNERIDTRYAEIAREWNRQWEYPKIIVSRVDEFFRYVEQNFADRIPVFRGDLGSYWEDGAGSSAYETALARLAKTRLTAAESLHALSAAHDPADVFPVGAIQSAWENILFYDEHTWGAAGSISDPEGEQTKHQWAFKAAYAVRAAQETDVLAQSGREAFMKTVGAKHLPSGRGTAQERITANASPLRVVTVLNACSWPRDIPVSVPLPAGEGNAQVKEAGGAGRAMPVQRSGDRLLFLARQVPPFGWRNYRLDPPSSPRIRGERGGLQAAPLLRRGADEWTWETPEFRLRFDPKTGAVASLQDRKGREWVDRTGGYGLNQFLYVLGGDGTGMIHPFAAAPKLNVYTHDESRIRLVENGPLRAVLHLERRGPQVPTADTWVIVNSNGRLDFVNALHKQPTYAKEAGYFAFPFQFQRPDKIRDYVELPYGIVEVDREQPPGACREWYSADNFAAAGDGQATAYLAAPHAPLLTVNDIWRGQWRGALGKLNGSLFSYAFNNYWHTNYKASQGGDMLFAYSVSLRLGGFDPAYATRFGRERMAAMPDPRNGGQPGVWAQGTAEAEVTELKEPAEGSLLRVMEGGAVVGGLTWSGDGLQVRLYNPSSKPTRAALALPGLHIREVWRVNLAGVREERLSAAAENEVKVVVPARGLVTLVLRAEPVRAARR
jgi:alpha-mannosidase